MANWYHSWFSPDPTDEGKKGGSKMAFLRVLGITLLAVILPCYATWGKIIKVPDNYSTLQKGIDAAESGDMVLVAPGRYNEQIVMKEGILLKSDSYDGGDEFVDGPGKKKILRRALRTLNDGSGYPAFTQASPMVEFPAGITRATVLDGFTVTKMPKVDHTLPGHAHTIQCRGSSPVIRNNIVIDNGSSGIGSHAQFKEGSSSKIKFFFENIAFHAHPLVENNVFAENLGAGIGNNHHSYATVLNNEVFGSISEHDHSAPGIGIQHGAHPLVEGNLVYNNDWSGIAARMGSQPVNRRTRPLIRSNTVINNGLAGNKKHGAGIGADGVGSADNPVTIENNTVGENRAAGIGIRNGGFVFVSGNTSYENDLAGIGVEKSSALLNNNTVYNNKRAGIGCREGRATIENNTIYRNRTAGVGLEGAKKTVIAQNLVHHNGISSIWTRIKNLFSFSRASFRSGVGVGMKKSEVLIFSANTIRNSAVPGLAVTEGSVIEKGEKNLIEKNGDDWAPNIALLDRSRATLSDTTIREGETANIYLSGSRLTLNNCLVEKAWRPGIVAEDGSLLKIDGGSISDNGAIGVLLEASRGNIRGAVIRGNEHHGIHAEENSSIRVEGCTVIDNAEHGGAGISVDGAEAYLVRNLIHKNDSDGVEADDAKLVMWNNVIADQEQGANIEGKSTLDVRNNIFAGHKAEALALEAEEPVKIDHLSHNDFWNNGGPTGRRPKVLNFLPTPPEGEEQKNTWGNLEVNPAFADPAGGDYRLRKDSPLIDAGYDLGLPFEGKAPDIGAFEQREVNNPRQ
jgi:hypothetical protein